MKNNGGAITPAHGTPTGVEHSHRTIILCYTQPSITPLFLQLRTPDIRSPDRLLFYLTAIMPPRMYIAFALIFIYSELRNSGTPDSELHHIT